MSCINCSDLALSACECQGTVKRFCRSHFDKHLEDKSCSHKLLTYNSFYSSSIDFNLDHLRRNHKLDEIILSLSEPKQALEIHINAYSTLKNHIISKLEEIISKNLDKYLYYKQELDSLISLIFQYKITACTEANDLIKSYENEGRNGLTKHSVEISSIDLKKILRDLEEALLLENLQNKNKLKISSLKKQLENIEEDLQIKELDLVCYKDEIQDLKKANQESTARTQQLENQLLNNRKEFKFMVESLRFKDKEISKLETDILKLEEKLKDQEIKLEKFKDHIKCKDNEIEINELEWTAKVNEILKEIEVFKEQKRVSKEVIREKDAQIVELQTSFRKTSEEVRSRVKKLAELTDELKRCQDLYLLKGLESRDLQYQILNLTQDLQQKDTQIYNLQLKLDSKPPVPNPLSSLALSKLSKFSGHFHNITSLALTSSNDFLFSSSRDTYLHKWDLQTNQLLLKVKGHERSICSIALTHDDSLLISSGSDCVIKLWKSLDLTESYKLEGHLDQIWSISIPLNDKFIVSASSDRSIRLWDLPNGERGHVFVGHSRPVHAVATSPDCNYIVSGSADATVRLWNISERSLDSILHGHASIVWCVCITSDSKYIVSGGQDAKLIIWSLDTKEAINVLNGHVNMVNCVSMMGSRYFISGSEDGYLSIWDIDNGEGKNSVEGHKDGVLCSVGSRDGKILATGGRDRNIIIWRFSH